MNSRVGEEGRWDFEAERLGVFEIDMQHVLRGLVHRQVGRLRSAQAFVAIGGGLSGHRRELSCLSGSTVTERVERIRP